VSTTTLIWIALRPHGTNLRINSLRRQSVDPSPCRLAAHPRERALRLRLFDDPGRLFEFIVVDADENGDGLAIGGQHEVVVSCQFANVAGSVSQIPSAEKLHLWTRPVAIYLRKSIR
jgi:hypothetical protein